VIWSGIGEVLLQMGGQGVVLVGKSVSPPLPRSVGEEWAMAGIPRYSDDGDRVGDRGV